MNFLGVPDMGEHPGVWEGAQGRTLEKILVWQNFPGGVAKFPVGVAKTQTNGKFLLNSILHDFFFLLVLSRKVWINWILVYPASFQLHFFWNLVIFWLKNVFHDTSSEDVAAFVKGYNLSKGFALWKEVMVSFLEGKVNLTLMAIWGLILDRLM